MLDLVTGIIPAYAGSTTRGHAAKKAIGDHPRIRGEHPTSNSQRTANMGSSPHTRGARTLFLPVRPARGIIPAYAGSTLRHASLRGAGRDHPRIRGEHCGAWPIQSTNSGSSPHTRGAPVAAVALPAAQGIIPAYAGSTCCRTATPRSRRDHPRIRGEHLIGTLAPELAAGSSPHTRGAH